MDDDEQDVYVSQLHEVFDSCDRVGKGFLDREELIELCRKLQLDDQIPQLLQQLLGSEEEDGQVTFEDFKEGFVAVLSLAIDNLSSSEDETETTLDNSEPPKLLKNEKRYGRTSKPDNSYSEDLYSADEESLVGSRPLLQLLVVMTNNGRGGDDDYDDDDGNGGGDVSDDNGGGCGDDDDSNRGGGNHNNDDNGGVDDDNGGGLMMMIMVMMMMTKDRGKVKRRLSSRKSSLRNSIRRHNSMKWQKKPSIEKTISQDEIEILEASGEMRSTQSPGTPNSGYASPEPSEEDQLKAIWNEVHVGANGFLDRHELALVCEHIGMDSMNEQDHYYQESIEEEFVDIQQSTPYSKTAVGGLSSTGRLKSSGLHSTTLVPEATIGKRAKRGGLSSFGLALSRPSDFETLEPG
ncbi:hypothetical protein QZH41_002838 [Actinostola sp. cb2023]|nr:hypothetical protein QZH41_002838 [Actinostola sp. cb2023]